MWYMCEAQSAIRETIQQYTTQFDNALHSSLCLSLLPTYTHTSTCHTDTHACAHFHYPSLQSLSQSLPPPTTTILEQSPIKMSAKEILKKWVQPPMSVRGLESLRIGRSKEKGFKRSCELWERTEVLDVTVVCLCSCISLSFGGYSIYAPVCLPSSLPGGMLISKNCLPVCVSVLYLCLRIDNIYAYHMSVYRQTVVYLMSVCPSKCACIHTHTHTPHHTQCLWEQKKVLKGAEKIWFITTSLFEQTCSVY